MKYERIYFIENACSSCPLVECLRPSPKKPIEGKTKDFFCKKLRLWIQLVDEDEKCVLKCYGKDYGWLRTICHYTCEFREECSKVSKEVWKKNDDGREHDAQEDLPKHIEDERELECGCDSYGEPID